MRLAVSQNGRFLVREDGAPFFYLADTAWELLHRCTLAEAELYLRDRAAKGFTVIQTVVLAELDGLRGPNRNGDLPLLEEDPGRPNEPYFAHVDEVVRIAAGLGLSLGLLPTWGDKWNLRWGTGPVVFDPGNARRFGEMLGRRYRDDPIIWIVGGDRPVETDEHRAVVRALADGLRSGDGGSHLITMHTWGQHSTTEYFPDEPWLDFHTVQSGHRRNFENWRMIEHDYGRSPARPGMDAEPAYELGADSIFGLEGGFLDDFDVRKALYWSLFAGAHGHTYGCWPIWQMWDVGREPVGWVLRTWRESLQAPGAFQVRHAADLLLSRPYLTRIPDQSLIVGDSPAGVHHVRATRDSEGSYAMVYIPTGQPVELDLGPLSGGPLRAWWFDPRTGTSTDAGRLDRTATTFRPPRVGPDWVLVIDDATHGFPRPGGR